MRAAEWWEFKLSPILASVYATALVLDVPVSSLWQAALVTLVALVPGAAYVSVINDLTDRDDDIAAGKLNRLAGRPAAYPAVLIAVTVGAGIAFCLLWRDDPLLLPFYLAAWLAFSLYSLPPFRWKARGVLGVMADASGAHLFPTLVAVVLAFRDADRPVNAAWVAAVGIWAFANGLRGILWHQLSDVESDRRAGVGTFAQKHSPQFVARLGAFVVFPFELAALAAMLWQMHSMVPVALLIAHALLTAVRVGRWKMNAVIVAPKPRYFIVLQEYYEALLPGAVLVASAWRYPLDLAVLALHLLLFPRRAVQAFHDVVGVGRSVVYRWR